MHPESTTPPSFPRTRGPRINKARLFPHPGDHCKTPVIPAPKPRHSRGRGDPESTKHAFPPSRRPLQNPRHSRAQAPSFPRTRESRINKARLFPHPGDHRKTPVIPAPKPRHSRGRGNPESIKHAFSPIPATIAKPPSFPRRRTLQRTEHPSRINKTPVIPAPKPRHSRGRGNPESIKHAFPPHPGDHCKTPVIPAEVGPSADGTSIQNQQRPRHSRAQAPSFPRTREPRINKARLFTPSRRQPPSLSLAGDGRIPD